MTNAAAIRFTKSRGYLMSKEPRFAPMMAQLTQLAPDETPSPTAITLAKLREEWTSPLQARIDKLEEALIWCSGSADFGDGGIAREGWLLLCAPLLKNLSVPTSTEEVK